MMADENIVYMNTIVKEKYTYSTLQEKSVQQIQKWYKQHIFQIKRLPTILYFAKEYLKQSDINFSTRNEDGRLNSCDDETIIINILKEKLLDRIKIPKMRRWYDILLYDKKYGWLPVNIKTTKMTTSDNTGNLAMCVYAYTNEKLDLDKQYDNGKMTDILLKKIKNKEFNKEPKKDYYFIVCNKSNPRQIIINSLKGLRVLTPNLNNLPFQVCWNKNKYFEYKPIYQRINQFIKCLKNPSPSWKERFISGIREIKDV